MFKVINNINIRIVCPSSIKNGKNEGTSLEVTRKFYDHALEELLKVEQLCEEYFINMKLDLSREAEDRLQPPFFVSLTEVRNSYEKCKDIERKEGPVNCRCVWKNISRSSLEDTANILNRPRLKIPTQFDDSDLKFKQEITILRAKMFALPKKGVKLNQEEDLIKGVVLNEYSSRKDFIEIANEKECFTEPSARTDFAKLNGLKFVDGEFTTCDAWTKHLDIQGNQMSSKWYLVVCPQIKKIMRKRRIPILHLDHQATLDFLLKIPQNGFNFTLTRSDLISLLENNTESCWLHNWRAQFKGVEGKDIAATLIQSIWRGYWLRKKIWESERLYIAASVLWFAWICLLKKRQMQQRYLKRMLMCLNLTRELSMKLSNEFSELVQEPHVIIHLPSLGYPLDIRQTFVPKMFSIHQNTTSWRISFIRNPRSWVIYVLPVRPTEDLLAMYSSIVDSISPTKNLANRVTFVALSEAKTFQNRPLNLSRILHCSEETLREIKKKIDGRPAYILPWIVDECDVRLAGNLGVPLLGPDMELQQKLLNASRMTEIIDGLGLPQPAHSRNVTDYQSLCRTLAELIVTHTEVCLWLIRLNFGVLTKHYGAFLINHISVPFMPILRREREKYGDEWMLDPPLKEEFLENLNEQLPKVVSSVTRIPSVYATWKDFYAHLQKFGCLVQAVPAEKNSNTVSVSLFVPGKATGNGPKWTGTADKLYLEANVSTICYMMPQSSVDISKVEPVVNAFAGAMQDEGYFGYLTVDCCCYPHKREEKLVVLLVNIRPYYSRLQSYIDWLKFSIHGSYSFTMNTFNTDVKVLPEISKRKSSYLFPTKAPKWNETTERFAIAISQLYHTSFSAYRWPKLKALAEENGITYDATRKQGFHLVLHDGEVRNIGMMMIISSCMTTTLSMTYESLEGLRRTLVKKCRKRADTNLEDVTKFFNTLSLSYQNLSADQCP
ncbi:hypothetical protein KM043_016306 [Ampulex compressa]|nr:hypothetical protein KM043_016306 [Ampulex compressa]